MTAASTSFEIVEVVGYDRLVIQGNRALVMEACLPLAH
jgi:hypothetical protein